MVKFKKCQMKRKTKKFKGMVTWKVKLIN